MQPSKQSTSVMFDVNMTELRAMFEKAIPEKFRIPGSSITLSFRDSSIGLPHWATLDISDSTIPALLRVSWQPSLNEENSGEEPTLSPRTE